MLNLLVALDFILNSRGLGAHGTRKRSGGKIFGELIYIYKADIASEK